MDTLIRFLPNIFTMLRLVLIIPIVWCILSQLYNLALLLFVMAGFTDLLDGYFARRHNCITRFGSIADPISDKILLLTSFLVFSLVALFPWWLFTLLIIRDIYILLGAISYHIVLGSYKITPHFSGKIYVFMQIVTVIVVLLFAAAWVDFFWLTMSFIALAMTTVMTVIIYSWIWWRRAYFALKECKKND
jgi:cardiolipin synthase (CMP-forming)